MALPAVFASMSRIQRGAWIVSINEDARAMSTEAAKSQANAKSQYTVTRADLPLSCPMPDMALWNSHPRVYLSIEDTGHATCPYCGAEFTLATD